MILIFILLYCIITSVEKHKIHYPLLLKKG